MSQGDEARLRRPGSMRLLNQELAHGRIFAQADGAVSQRKV
ncbi:MAG: hypothetical protein ACYCY7_02245 [Gallionella sp.]